MTDEDHKTLNELVDHFVSQWKKEQHLPKNWKDMRDFADYILSMMFIIAELMGVNNKYDRR